MDELYKKVVKEINEAVIISAGPTRSGSYIQVRIRLGGSTRVFTNHSGTRTNPQFIMQEILKSYKPFGKYRGDRATHARNVAKFYPNECQTLVDKVFDSIDEFLQNHRHEAAETKRRYDTRKAKELIRSNLKYVFKKGLKKDQILEILDEVRAELVVEA